MGEFLPVIGDAASGDEFGKAAAQGDKTGMFLAGLGVIPAAGDAAKKAAKSFKDEFSKLDLYHGTNKEFDSFDLSKLGSNTGSVNTTRVFTALEPEAARHFAELAVKNHGGNARVLNLVHRVKRPTKLILTGKETPKTGKVVIFDHTIPHESTLIESGMKQVIRTDVMYKRKEDALF